MWAGAPNCYMDMLDTFRNEYVGLLVQYLLVSLEPLGHRKNIASLYLFYRYYWFSFLILEGRLRVIAIDVMTICHRSMMR